MHDRAFLHQIKFYSPQGLVLGDGQIVPAQRLECMGLVTITAMQMKVWIGPFCKVASQASITPAGRRVFSGPLLASADGVRFDFDPPPINHVAALASAEVTAIGVDPASPDGDRTA